MEQSNRLPIFRERLRLLMGNASNTEFAKTIGISRQTLGFYLNGDRIPDCETLAQICQKCNVSSNWFLGLSNDMAMKSHSVDELGLSPQSVNALLGIRAHEDASEILEGLNMFLEGPGTAFLAQKIKRAKDYVQSELSFSKHSLRNEYDPNESGLPYSDFMDMNDIDLAESLEDELLEHHPELLGRFVISCGKSALDRKFKEIIEQFDCEIRMITGYYDYLTDRLYD